MIYLALLLYLIGIMFLLAELFIPGFGVLGVCGLIAIIFSFLFTILGVKYGGFIVASEVIVLFLLGKSLYTRFGNSQFFSRFILNDTLIFSENEVEHNNIIGKIGKTKTSCRPFGLALFEEKMLDVYSMGSYISENKDIKIIAIENNKIFVEEVLQTQYNNNISESFNN